MLENEWKLGTVHRKFKQEKYVWKTGCSLQGIYGSALK